MAVVQRLPDSEQQVSVDPTQLSIRPPDLDPQTGRPKQIYRKKVHHDPDIIISPHFLTAAETQHLIALGEGQWVPSLVRKLDADAGEKRMEKGEVGSDFSTETSSAKAPSRTSWSCQLRPAQTDVVDEIERRLAALTGLPVDTLEHLSLVKYSPGEYFNRHHDGGYRPITVFIYLNDLPDASAGGETFFPVLGVRVVPRHGSAVMWWNCTTDDGEEPKLDSRMVHEGRAGIKYGVNCFFNEEVRRHVRIPSNYIDWQDSQLIPLAEMRHSEDAQAGTLHRWFDPAQKLMGVANDPRIMACPAFLTPHEVNHFIKLAGESLVQDGCGWTLRVLEPAETPETNQVEQRLCKLLGYELPYFGNLRLSRSRGPCDRLGGTHGCVVSLEAEEILFPHVGLSLAVAPGDLITWRNVCFEGTSVFEDLRTARLHRKSVHADYGGGTMRLEAWVHEKMVRLEHGSN